MKNFLKSKSTKVILPIVGLIAVVLFIMWSRGVFYIIDRQTSPNKAITTTVYSRDVSDTFPKNTGFTIKDTGASNRTKIYNGGSTFESLHWSPCSEYAVISTLYNGERYLELLSYNKNSVSNLGIYINMDMSNHSQFTTLMTQPAHWESLEFEFLNWAEEKDILKVKFSFEGNNNKENSGTLEYNCQTGKITNILFNK